MQTQRGDGKRITLIAGVTCVSGTPILVGQDLFVIPYTDAASGALVAVQTDGEHAIPKVSAAIADTLHTAGETLVQGDRLFWDNINKVLTLKPIGPFVATVIVAAAEGDETVQVLLRPAVNDIRGTAVGLFDATAGKAVGTHTLVGTNNKVPKGAIITRYSYLVLTTCTSATDAGTLSLGVTTDDVDNIKAATAISSGTTYDATGLAVNAAPAAGTVTTAERALTGTVAVEAFTAGVLMVYADWIKVAVT